MKINVHTNKKHKDTFRWLEKVAIAFFDEHDIILSNNAWLWMRTPEGCKTFVNWLRGLGWQVEYWELPMFADPAKNGAPRHIGYGMEFNETCPMFVEAKLKQ